MSIFRNFKDFFHYNKEIVYLITLGYIVLIIAIIMLILKISDQNGMIILLQNGINKHHTTECIKVPQIEGVLESECRMFFQSSHK